MNPTEEICDEEIELGVMYSEEGSSEDEEIELPQLRSRSPTRGGRRRLIRVIYPGEGTTYDEEIQELSEWDQHIIKIAALRASPGIVSIITHLVPEKIVVNFGGSTRMAANRRKPKNIHFYGCGMVIESGTQATDTSNNSQYLSTVIAPASLFQHLLNNNTLTKTDIVIDVFGSTGISYNAQLLAWDFHNNLAAISITSDSLLPTVTLNHIDDTLSIYPTHHIDNTSTSFKVAPKTLLISVWRSRVRPCRLRPASAFFSSSSSWGLSCNELYYLNGITYPESDGGPVLDPTGQVIGIIFNNASFLPSNTVSRWWNHYKSSGRYRRPFVGMEVANLPDTKLKFKAQFMIRFPEIFAAVVVTKVEKDSLAAMCGIRTNDVIVKLDDKPVRSKLEFYETIWEKVGEVMKANVLRVAEFEELNLSLAIGETPSNKFNQWPRPDWRDLGLVGVPRPSINRCQV